MKNSRRLGSVVALYIALVTAGCVSYTTRDTPVQTQLADTAVAMDMHELGVPLIPISVNGAAGVAMVDTGAQAVFVSSKFVKDKRIRTDRAHLATRDAGGEIAIIDRKLSAATLKIGEARFEGVDALVHSLRSLNPGFGANQQESVHAVVGINVFADALVTFDCANDKLVIERGELPPADGKEIFDIRQATNGYMLLTLNVDGTNREFLVDSGASSMFLLPRGLKGAYPKLSPSIQGGTMISHNSSARSELSRLNADIRIGHHRFRRPIVAMVDTAMPVVGFEFISQFKVTIDQKNDRIRLTRPLDDPIETPVLRKIGFETEGKSWTVSTVELGGTAAAAGLRVGDQVVSVNGIKPTDLMARTRIRNAMMQGKVLLQVQRGSETLNFELPIVELLP